MYFWAHILRKKSLWTKLDRRKIFYELYGSKIIHRIWRHLTWKTRIVKMAALFGHGNPLTTQVGQLIGKPQLTQFNLIPFVYSFNKWCDCCRARLVFLWSRLRPVFSELELDHPLHDLDFLRSFDVYVFWCLAPQHCCFNTYQQKAG